MSNHGPKFFESVGLPFHSKLYCALGKRVSDIVLTLLALFIVLPIIGFLALLIASDGGKPFYSQNRIGKGGRVYRMWKLRSTLKDADGCLEHHRRHEEGNEQNLIEYPCLSKLGLFLRESSLDELPRLFNVLIGDMSLVGPQPMMVSQKALYPGGDYYDLRPGITGLWQSSARHHMTLTERAVCDSQYNQTLSLANDLVILAATIKAALRTT